jgi:hypothetical protein
MKVVYYFNTLLAVVSLISNAVIIDRLCKSASLLLFTSGALIYHDMSLASLALV